MELNLSVLAFLSVGLLTAMQTPSVEDVAGVTANPPNTLSRLAGQAGHEQHLTRPADPVSTNAQPTSLAPSMREPASPEPTMLQRPRRKFSWRELFGHNKPSTMVPTKPQINWSNDYSTNLVRKWPALFLPWGSKYKKWDTHVCKVLSREGCQVGNAKIEMEPSVFKGGRLGPAYTTVTDLKPEIRGVKEVYISRHGRMRLTRPEHRPSPDDKEYRKSRQRAHERLKRIADMTEADERRGPSLQEIVEARRRVNNWEETEMERERLLDIWWAHQRWREDH